MSKLHSEQINFNSGTNVEEVIEDLQAKDAQFLGATPEALNTFEKLAAAINNDPNFFQTLNNALAGKFNTNGILVSSQVRHNNEALDGFLAVVEANAAEEYIHPGTHPVEMIVGAMTAADVDAKIAAVIDSSPETLNTLNELAAALNDDPNFATTVSAQIGTKLDASAYTAADVLSKLKTVDGAGSGLDADLFDGLSSADFTKVSGGTVSNGHLRKYQYLRDYDDDLAANTGIRAYIRDGIWYLGKNTNEANAIAIHIEGNKVWHAGNDGSGSGLNADMLDGIHESTFMRKAANGNLDMNSYVIKEVGQIQLTDGNTYIDEGSGNAVRLGTNNGYIDMGPQNTSYAHISTNISKFHMNKPLYVAGEIYAGTSYNQKVWHAGNDGSGSGLDADKLDGLQASQFLRADANTTTTGILTAHEIIAGQGSGSVALTINDGQGNANVTFNHKDGKPDISGNAARIEVNTDSTTGASIKFAVKSNVTANTAVTLTDVLTVNEGGAEIFGTGVTTMKKLSKTFTAGASSVTVSDAFIVESSCKVDIVPQGTPAGTWEVSYSNGSFTITSSSAEPSAIAYIAFITKIN